MIMHNKSGVSVVVVVLAASLVLVATLLTPQCQCCRETIDNDKRTPSDQNQSDGEIEKKSYTELDQKLEFSQSGPKQHRRRPKSQARPKPAPRMGSTRGEYAADLIDTVRPEELTKERPCTSGFSCRFQQQCGLAPLNPSSSAGGNQSHGYITVGKNATYGEWPSFVALEFSSKFICGGVLITDRHVLTAAHCTYELSKRELRSLFVVLGDHRVKVKDKFEQRFGVSSVCQAKKYFHQSTYDFSILTLKERVQFNDHIQPACLPFKPLKLTEETECVVVGIGKTLKMYPEVLQKLPLRQVSCRIYGLRDDDRSRQCWAGHNNHRGDSCNGDSGGPVLCLSPEKRWTVMGLVSYGSTRCDGTQDVGWVAVYTRVQALLGHMNADCGA